MKVCFAWAMRQVFMQLPFERFTLLLEERYRRGNAHAW
jgi:hypothetical protein